MHILEIVAVLSCAMFAGAAIYINVAEHPARLECGTELAATVFGPSYHRAAAMQASLAVIATIAGVAAGARTGTASWFIGACLIFLVIPFTFVAIMPTNNALLDSGARSLDGCNARVARAMGAGSMQPDPSRARSRPSSTPWPRYRRDTCVTPRVHACLSRAFPATRTA